MPDPEWCPVAGGKGWGIPTGKDCSSGGPQMTAQSIPTSPSTYSNSTQGYGQGSSLPTITNTTSALSDRPNSPNTSGDSAQVDNQDTPALSDEQPTIPSPVITPTSSTSAPASSASASASASGYASSADDACPAEEDEEEDETCAADEVESEEAEPEAEQPEVQLERPGAAVEEPEAGGQYAEEEEDTCAADEVWED